MRKSSFVLTIFFLFSFTAPCRAELKKVRLAAPTFDIITLPLKFAQAKGFYENPSRSST
jgi:hypothetical protein